MFALTLILCCYRSAIKSKMLLRRDRPAERKISKMDTRDTPPPHNLYPNEPTSNSQNIQQELSMELIRTLRTINRPLPTPQLEYQTPVPRAIEYYPPTRAIEYQTPRRTHRQPASRSNYHYPLVPRTETRFEEVFD